MAKIEILKVRDLTFTMYDSGAVDVTRGKAMVLHIKASEVARIQAEAQRQIDALLASVAPQKAAR